MALSEAFLPEFDLEMVNTRKVLERVPEDKFTWKPHVKSFSMGDLATHLATIPEWFKLTFSSDSLDLMPEGKPIPTARPAGSTKELLERFDAGVAAARTILAGASDEQLAAPWTLLANGKTLFTIPRAALVRSFIFSHTIHHRAQLGLYLRLNDIPLPQVYGPTADESAI